MAALKLRPLRGGDAAIRVCVRVQDELLDQRDVVGWLYVLANSLTAEDIIAISKILSKYRDDAGPVKHVEAETEDAARSARKASSDAASGCRRIAALNAAAREFWEPRIKQDTARILGR